MLYDARERIESLKKIKSQLYVHKFETKDHKIDQISVLCTDTIDSFDPFLPGYFILKDGAVLPVVFGDTHPNVATKYLKKYYGSKWDDIRRKEKSCIEIMFELGAVMYIGPRSSQSYEKEFMFLTYAPPFMLSEEQIEKLLLLEQSILAHHCSCTYHGRGTTIYDNLYDPNQKNDNKHF